MTYDPPAGDSLTFDLLPYRADSRDEADFDFSVEKRWASSYSAQVTADSIRTEKRIATTTLSTLQVRSDESLVFGDDYEPPVGDNITFDLIEYTPPARTESDFNFGGDIFERIARGVVNPVQATNSGALTLPRTSESQAQPAVADGGRVMSASRAPSIHTARLDTASARDGLGFDRGAGVFTDGLLADNGRSMEKHRQDTTGVGDVSIKADRVYNASRDPTIYSDSLTTRTEGILGLDRTAIGVVNPLQANQARSYTAERDATAFSRDAFVDVARSMVNERDAEMYADALFSGADRQLTVERDGTTFVVEVRTDAEEILVFGDDYEPPVADNITFELMAYRPPSRTEADFRFDAIFRLAAAFVESAAANSIQSTNKPRGAGTHTGTVIHDSAREAALGRTSVLPVDTITADAQRDGMAFARAADSFASAFITRADGFYFTNRIATMTTNSVDVETARWKMANRSPTAHTQPVMTLAQRIQSLVRAAEVHTGALRLDVSHSVTKPRVSTAWTDESLTSATRAIEQNREATAYVQTLAAAFDGWFPHWSIDGQQIPDLIAEHRDVESLRLAFEINAGHLEDRLESTATHAGKYDVVTTGDGGFRTLDRTTDGASNTYTLRPPGPREDLRVHDEWLVHEMSEEPLDQVGEEFEAEIEFVASENVDPDEYDYDTLTDEATLWHIETTNGDVLTRRVSYSVAEEFSDDITVFDLDLVLEREEAAVIEHTVTKPHAVYVQDVPDGENIIRDSTSDDTNTITLSPPTGSDTVIESGDYVIEEWSSEWRNDSYQEVHLRILGPLD